MSYKRIRVRVKIREVVKGDVQEGIIKFDELYYGGRRRNVFPSYFTKTLIW